MTRAVGVHPNVAAFLDALAVSELTQALLDRSNDGYDVLVGATATRPQLFTNYAAHPHKLNPALNSTAAGRYQITYPTWSDLVAKLHLQDFSPVSQDLACVELLQERHAVDLLEAGRFDLAVAACARTWASLPGSTAGQRVQLLGFLREVWLAKGGRFVP